MTIQMGVYRLQNNIISIRKRIFVDIVVVNDVMWTFQNVISRCRWSYDFYDMMLSTVTRRCPLNNSDVI